MKGSFRRLLRHLCFPPWKLRQALPQSTLDTLTQAIGQSERGHSGEIHFAVENALHWRQLRRGLTARDRAVEVFSQLRVWDTEDNNGVLIYLLLADRAVEIVADRSVARKLSPPEWACICQQMQARFRQAEFEAGILIGIAEVGRHLNQHFSGVDHRGNELPNEPTLIRSR